VEEAQLLDYHTTRFHPIQISSRLSGQPDNQFCLHPENEGKIRNRQQVGHFRECGLTF
jgi:hypothetical protein